MAAGRNVKRTVMMIREGIGITYPWAGNLRHSPIATRGCVLAKHDAADEQADLSGTGDCPVGETEWLHQSDWQHYRRHLT